MISLFTITLILLLIMDPIGNINSFLKLVDGLDRKRQRIIVLREMMIALVAMLVFNYLGEVIFDFLSLSETTVRLSSGIILFLIAIKILFTAPDSVRANLPGGEPFVFPIAIPLIAGPALLATIMLFAHLETHQSVMLSAILIAWFFCITILYFSRPIKRILKNNGLLALERLIGMVLVLMAVQRLLEGFLSFWEAYKLLPVPV
jgi:multiple antibiotic resistance protein